MNGLPESQHQALLAAYEDELQARFPRMRVIRKSDSRLCSVIDRVLSLITAGGQKSFLDRYVTTLGSRIYVPDDWPSWPAGHRYCVLRHEAVHVDQFRRFTWPGMVLLYLLLPLPLGFAAGRAGLEWQAYRETLVATWQVYGRDAAHSPSRVDDMVRRFTGPDYVWMWVHEAGVRRAISRFLARLDERPPAPLSFAPAPPA